MPKLSVDVLISPAAREAAMREDIRIGLNAEPKSIPPVWFYDETGSQLFDRITRLPEYYLTRAERAILADHAGDIADRAGPSTLVEIGSGTSEKTRLLLDAMAASGSLRGITLLDISEEILRQAATELCDRYDVNVHAVVCDLRSDLSELSSDGNQLWAFLGSTIGNFRPAERGELLSGFRTAMGPSDHLLLGTDLVKGPDRLVCAYDDGEGVTAAFNRNVLSVLNDALSADFDVDRYRHVARWNAAESWIEMRLRSMGSQSVTLSALDMKVGFDDGEEILTEISSKFDPARVPGELAAAGLAFTGAWTDTDGDFMLSLSAPRRT